MTRGSRLQPLARAVLRTQPDERLVALSREGREAAFEEIVRRYRTALVAFAAAYAPRERAEDVVQESFVSSWDALRSSTEEIRLKPWLYTIVRNRALNARRDARPHDLLSDEIAGSRQPDDIVLTNEELGRVVAAVGALPEAQREALVRSAVQGHTHEQIAAAIGASPGAVRQLIYRGRLAVREGVGLIIPLPLVRSLADLGGGDAAAAAVAGGAAAAGGASVLSKATVATVIGAIAIGSGVAIKRSTEEQSHAAPPPRSATSNDARSPSGSGGDDDGRAVAAVAGDDSSGADRNARGGAGEDRPRDDPGRDAGGDDRTSPGRGADDDELDGSSGHGAGSDDDDPPSSDDGHGSGDDDDDPPTGDDDTGEHSGSGGSESSGSGESESKGSGSGSDDQPDEVEEAEDADDSSGSDDEPEEPDTDD
jgi:RNA polymerase sigma factor (sigma-70 family)